MKKRFSLAIFLWVIFLSLASISVVTSSNIQTNVLSTRVNVAPSKPTVEIIYPTQGDILEFGTHTVNVLASDPTGIDKVKLKIDGPESTNGWVDITSTGEFDHYYYDWAVGTEGDYSITARATNGAGRQAADTVGVTVVAAPPEPVHDVAVTSVSASPTSVEIGENVLVTVDVENQGDFMETFEVISYYDSVLIGTHTVIELAAGASDTLTFTWNTTDIDEGDYTIKAVASSVAGETDTTDNSFTDGTVTVSAPGAPPTYTHELFIEIDYMAGHKPTPEVLDYIEWYYNGNNPSGELINVTFYVDDEVQYDPSVTKQDFWDIEAVYNNLGDDAYGTGDPNFGTAAVYSSKWKWVLFGTVDGEWGAMGYCYVYAVQVGRREADMLAGNYMFVADGAADAWSASNGIEPYGAEAVILMHEMGHSIGIGIIEWHPLWGWHEVYDSDTGSVMSYLSTDNAGLYWAWYYSDDYWATRNMEYYTI